MTSNRRTFLTAPLILIPALIFACHDSTSPVAEPAAEPLPTTPPPVPPTGSIEVVSSTTGATSGLGSYSYSLTVDGGERGKIGINQSAVLASLVAGKHVVRIDGLAPNCAFIGPNQLAIDVVAGSQVQATFSILCTAVAPLADLEIAYVVGIDTAANIWASRADGSGAVQLTSQTGFDGDPAWSRDGKKIVFSSKRDGKYEIYSMNADGTDQVRLTNSPGNNRQPALSPDGTRIAFVGQVPGYSWDKIYVMNADGTGITTLSGGNIGNESSPDWSPDGSSIAYAGQFPGGMYDKVMGIGTMKPDGTERRQLTFNYRDDLMPAWSPDGKKIAFAQTLFYQTDIYILNVDGSGLNMLANGADASDPAWSADGTKLTFGGFSTSNGFCWGRTGPNYSCNLFIRAVGADGSFASVLPTATPAYDATWRRR